jgi:Ca-activated chloride channel family protein
MVDQMLLLSDGEATTGVKDEAGFRRIAATIQRQGSSISTIGVDVDYNERVMSAIAEETNGRHHFVANVAKLPSIFDEEFKSLSNTLADEVELNVSLAPGVRILEVFDRSYRRVGDSLVVPLGAFSAGDEKTLLIKVSAAEGQVGIRPIADVRLSYQDLTTNRRGTCEGSLSQALVADLQELTPLDPLVASRVERSETARTLLGANALIKEGKSDAARELLNKAKVKKRKAARRFAQSPFESATKGSDDLKDDFDRQEQALAAAEAEVAPGPAGKPVAPQSRRAKAAVRTNQSIARDATF